MEASRLAGEAKIVSSAERENSFPGDHASHCLYVLGGRGVLGLVWKDFHLALWEGPSLIPTMRGPSENLQCKNAQTEMARGAPKLCVSSYLRTVPMQIQFWSILIKFCEKIPTFTQQNYQFSYYQYIKYQVLKWNNIQSWWSGTGWWSLLVLNWQRKAREEEHGWTAFSCSHTAATVSGNVDQLLKWEQL